MITPAPSSGLNAIWMPLLSGVALLVGLVAILLARSALENQARSVPRPESADASQAVREAPSPDAKLNAPAAEYRSNVVLPREPAPLSVDSLTQELDQLALHLDSRYPNSAEAVHVVAMLKAQTRQYAQAQERWRQCMALDPKQERYYVNSAAVAMERGDYELALTILQDAQKRGFQSLDIVHHLALSLQGLGQSEGVIGLMENSLQRYPDIAADWLILGQAYLDTGAWDKAEESLRKALSLGLNSPAVYVALGNACARSGKKEEAAIHLKTYAAMKAKDTLTGTQRYESLSTQELKQTAMTILIEAAVVTYRNKDLLQTERLLSRRVAIDPKDIQGLRALADFYFKTKSLANERVVRERIVEWHPVAFRDFLDLAKVHAQMGQSEGAEAVLKQAMATFPNSVEPYAALAQFCMDQNRSEPARWYAQQSLECAPSSEGFRFLAAICDKMNDLAGAAQARKLAQEWESRK
jgi:tetratricopeptide (TPR) repeat protein